MWDTLKVEEKDKIIRELVDEITVKKDELKFQLFYLPEIMNEVKDSATMSVRITILIPKKECHCTPRQIQNYISRISGPLLDRIDIHVEVPNVQYKDLTSDATCESSEEIREEVTNGT